jgi:hypothetical protein
MTLLLGLLSIIIFLSGSTMGDYMRPKTAPGSEGGATLFTLRYFTQHLFNYTQIDMCEQSCTD